MDRVINTRDVIFNEEVFDGDWKNFQDELLEADVQKIAEFIQNHSMAEDEERAAFKCHVGYVVWLEIISTLLERHL